MSLAVEHILAEVPGLELEDLKLLNALVHEQIIVVEVETRCKVHYRSSDEVLERRMIGLYTYQLEYYRCGLADCECIHGVKHGPHWFVSLWRDGRIERKCLGTKLEIMPERGSKKEEFMARDFLVERVGPGEAKEQSPDKPRTSGYRCRRRRKVELTKSCEPLAAAYFERLAEWGIEAQTGGYHVAGK